MSTRKYHPLHLLFTSVFCLTGRAQKFTPLSLRKYSCESDDPLYEINFCSKAEDQLAEEKTKKGLLLKH